MILLQTKLNRSFLSLPLFNRPLSHPIRFSETLVFSRRRKKSPHYYSSMAEVENNNITTVPLISEDEQYGFKRPEMYTTTLAGTAGSYARHAFLCYKSHETWPPRVETEGLPQLFAKSFKDHKSDFPVETRLTVCGGGSESDGDVLIFPEMIKYKGIKETDVDAFVEDVFVNGKEWITGIKEELSGSFVFVCAHGSRDNRCGVCGPVLMEKFEEEISLRGLEDNIIVESCSHIGGHKYAGNLIVFSPDLTGKISGHWYGYVTPDDVVLMIDQHIGKGEIIEKLSRGQMGLKPEDEKKDEKVGEAKIANGNGVVEREAVEKGMTGGCCQGVNGGGSCCQEETTEEGKKEGSSVKSNWFASVGKEEILLGAAVVGAVTTVAVAYSVYRRSG